MSWDKEIEELRKREALAQRMGGPEKVKRQRDGGKLTVRERIDRLLDPGSFHEIGALSGVATYGDGGELADVTPANLVMGRGRIGGRPVAITGDDFTVRGGANDGGVKHKLLAVERMACDLRLPLVRLVDGTGGGGSVKNLELQGHSPMPKAFLWDWWTDNLSEVPVVSLALGSVAGLGAARVVASHYSVMVKESSQLFVAGPPVVEWTHGKFGKNELGGSHIHTRNGAVDDEAESEDDAFERARRFLSYLPSSVHELPERAPSDDDPARRDAWLLEAVPRDPRKVYNMRSIIASVADRDSFFETGPALGTLDRHRACAALWLAGGAHGRRPDALRRRLDRARIRKDHALRRPRAVLPPAGGAPGRLPGLPDRAGGGEGGHDPLRHARRERDPPVPACPGAR